MRFQHLVCAPAAVLAAACAHRPPPAMHTTKLLVRTEAGTPVPYIRATVDGHPLIFVVDTGSQRSLLPAGFAVKYDLPTMSTTANPLMVDVNGTVRSLPRVSGSKVRFDGESTFDVVDFLVNTADGSDAVGILSPQELVRSGWALVLDFPHDELRYEPEQDALKRLAATSQFIELDYRSCELDNRRVTPVTINGVASSLLIDTGSSRTVLARNNEAIPGMASRLGKHDTHEGMMSTGRNLLVSGIPLAFASSSFDVSAWVFPNSSHCGRGVLGADVLRNCILVWGSKSLWASCRGAS